jgi:O-antigen ligase
MNNFPARPGGTIGQWLASSINEMAVTLWTCLSFYLMYVTGGQNEFVLFIPLAAGAAVFVAMTYRKPVLAKIDPVLSAGVFGLVFSILASYLFNSERYEMIFVAGNLVSAVLLFISLYAITSRMDLDYKKLLIFQCVFATPVLPVILATSHMQWGRVMPEELTPNYVGMMALVCFIGACSARSLWAVAVLAALPLYSIIVMQSRNSLLACATVGLIVLWYRLRGLGWKKLRPYLAMVFVGGPIICVGLYFAGFNVLEQVTDVFDNLTMINDEHRGINSGGSGRAELWQAAFNLWLAQPIFGVGFKGSPGLLPENLPAHNAYLGMLAETGLVGFISYLIIVFVGIYYILKRGARLLSEYPERVAILVSYLLYGMLESRAFSFGNTYSLLFLLVTFDSSKHRVKPAFQVDFRRRDVPSAQPEATTPTGLISRSKLS